MLAKRIIPCLDISSDGRVVKGVNFVDLIDAGDPVEAAKEYNRMGADEIVFLDIAATHEGRKNIVDVIERTAEEAFGCKLLDSTIGGRHGGGAVLTPEAKILLEGYQRLRRETEEYSRARYMEIFTPLLASVETRQENG